MNELWSTTTTTKNEACIPIQDNIDNNQYALTLYRGHDTLRNDWTAEKIL